MDPISLVRAGKQALDDGKVQQAITILSAASAQGPKLPQAWFYLGAAFARGSQHDMAALCFFKATMLVSPDSPALAQQLRIAAADNLWLESSKVLPTGWMAAANDASRAAAFGGAAQWCIRQASSTKRRVAQQTEQGDEDSSAATGHVCCVGGIGLEALQLALAADSSSNRADSSTGWAGSSSSIDSHSSPGTSGAATAVSAATALTLIAQDQLSALMAQRLLAANGLLQRVAVLQAGPQAAGSQGLQTVDAVLLAGSCGPSVAVGSMRSSLAELAPHLAPGVAIAPMTVLVRGVLAHSADLLAMNAVDVDAMAAGTGGLQYAGANMLSRPQRPMQVSCFSWAPLSQVFTAHRIDMQQLLSMPQALQGAMQAIELPVPVTAAGSLDCIIWWLDYELAPGCVLSYAPDGLEAVNETSTSSSADGGQQEVDGPQAASLTNMCQQQQQQTTYRVGGAVPDVLRPHAWQHVAYMPNGQAIAVSPGDTVLVHSELNGASVDMAPVAHSSSTAAALATLALTAITEADDEGEEVGDGGGAAEGLQQHAQQMRPNRPQQQPIAQQQQQQQRQQQEQQQARPQQQEGQAAPGCTILPYHMSMLNDRPRTAAYRQGIEGAVARMLQQTTPSAAAAGGGPAAKSGEAAGRCAAGVVLDVGSGTGLLAMMAARAGAPCVIGCEREPALAATAQQLLLANGLQDQVHIVQKLSSQLTVGEAGDLPGRASLVVHEVFGTDPLSEGVLPTLRQVQEHLASPTATYMPHGIRIIAALASSPLLQALHKPHSPAPAPAAQPCSHGSSGGPLPNGTASGNTSCYGSSAGAPAATSSASPNPPYAAADPCGQPQPSAAAPNSVDLSALAALAPRKADIQAAHVPDLLLHSTPAPVLVIDFATAPLPLRGERLTRVQLLAEPLPLKQWMEQQQQQQQQEELLGAMSVQHEQATGSRCDRSSNGASTSGAAQPAAHPTAAAAGKQEDAHRIPDCVLYWFEADCGNGGWLSTAPGNTHYGHWTQVVEWLGNEAVAELRTKYTPEGSNAGAPAAHATGIGEVVLRCCFLPDRVRVLLDVVGQGCT